MRSWIKGSLFALLTFGVCWVGAVWSWRATNRMPSTSDLVLTMLALPVGILAAVWIGRKVLQARADKPAAAPAAAAASNAAEPAPAARAAALAVLGAALRTPHGDTPDDLAAALDEGTARPTLDPELVDDHGYPAMTARSTSAGDAAWREDAERWFAAQGRDVAGFGDAQWRALELASSVTAELVETAAQLPHPSTPDGVPALPHLRIVPLAPAEWLPPQRGAALDWLAHVAVQAGWPAARVSATPPPAESAAATVALLSLLSARADSGASLSIVLAFDSHIDQASMDRLAHEGSLFTAAHAQGLVPGEGAAALLLTDPAHAQLLDADAPLAHAGSAARAGSADASKRPDATELRRLAARMLAEQGIQGADVALLMADSDHRTNRVLELMALTHGDLAHLDAGLDVRTTGAACGYSGAVPFLAALALARQQAVERAAPVLCVSNLDPIHRSAALIRPAGAVPSSAT